MGNIIRRAFVAFKTASGILPVGALGISLILAASGDSAGAAGAPMLQGFSVDLGGAPQEADSAAQEALPPNLRHELYEGASIPDEGSGVTGVNGSANSFRDLLLNPPGAGQYQVLSEDIVSTRTREWKERMRREVEGSPYADITLPELISLALEYNFELQNNRRNVLSAESRYFETQSNFIPFATLVAGASYENSKAGASETLRKVESTSMEVGLSNITQNLPTGGSIRANTSLRRNFSQSDNIGSDDMSAKDYTYSHDLTIEQPLLRGAGFDVGLMNDVRQGRLDEMAALIDEHIARRDVAFDVIQQYFTIISTIANIEVRLRALEVNERLIRDTRIRYDLGQSIPSEISKAEVQYLNSERSFVQLEQQLRDQLQRLLNTLGLDLNTPISLREITGTVLDSQAAGIPDEEEARYEALANNPDLLASIIALRRAEISLTEAKNALLPSLDASVSFSNRDTQLHSADAVNLDDRRVWSAGLGFAYPLPNISEREAAKRAEWSLETAKTNKTIRERNLVIQIDGLIRELARREESIMILRRSVEEARRTYEADAELFIYGERTSNDVIDAQNSYFAAQQDYNSELLDYQTALAQVYQVLGRQLF